MEVKGKGVRQGLMVLGVVLAMTGAALAQGGPGGAGGQPPSASEMVAKMKTTLSLTDAQVTKVTAIMEEEISQMTSLMKSGNPETGRSKMESLRQATEAKLAQVLTAEQLAKWKSSKPQGGPGGGNRSSGSGSSSSSNSSGSSSSRSSSGSGIW